MPGSPEMQAADLALMQGVATGETGAIERLYDRFGSLVYRMAVQSLPKKDLADEAVQEVFIRLWKTAYRYDPTRAALVTWVMLITRRYLVDRLRRNRSALKPAVLDEKITGETEIGAVPSPLRALERQERYSALMSKIDKLPDLQKKVVTRAYLNGQTLRQIGEELNTPLGTVKSALSRALVRLRETDTAEGTTV